MKKIYKNEYGYFIFMEDGNIVYFPDFMNNEEAVDFITDWFDAKKD